VNNGRETDCPKSTAVIAVILCTILAGSLVSQTLYSATSCGYCQYPACTVFKYNNPDIGIQCYKNLNCIIYNVALFRAKTTISIAIV